MSTLRLSFDCFPKILLLVQCQSINQSTINPNCKEVMKGKGRERLASKSLTGAILQRLLARQRHHHLPLLLCECVLCCQPTSFRSLAFSALLLQQSQSRRASSSSQRLLAFKIFPSSSFRKALSPYSCGATFLCCWRSYRRFHAGPKLHMTELCSWHACSTHPSSLCSSLALEAASLLLLRPQQRPLIMLQEIIQLALAQAAKRREFQS